MGAPDARGGVLARYWTHWRGCIGPRNGMTMQNWLASLELPPNTRLDYPSDRVRVRGGHKDPLKAIDDYLCVVDSVPPGAYRLTKAEIVGQPSRGVRLTWSVTWLSEEVAERRYRARLDRDWAARS